MYYRTILEYYSIIVKASLLSSINRNPYESVANHMLLIMFGVAQHKPQFGILHYMETYFEKCSLVIPI
jgi:hypothetical protein